MAAVAQKVEHEPVPPAPAPPPGLGEALPQRPPGMDLLAFLFVLPGALVMVIATSLLAMVGVGQDNVGAWWVLATLATIYGVGGTALILASLIDR